MLIGQHGEALRADFRRFYQLSLVDCITGRAGMGLQEVAGLASQLPPGAMTWREYGGPMAWTDEVASLVGVRYRLDILAWQKANQGKTVPSPQPKVEEPPPYAAERRAARDRLEAKALRTLKRMQQQEQGIE